MSALTGVAADYLLGKFLDVLPSWLIRRLAPPDQLARRLRVDLRGDRAIVVSRGTVPKVDLWFEIANNGPLDVMLDRFLVSFWFGGPLFDAYELERRRIPKGGGEFLLRCTSVLTAGQLTELDRNLSQEWDGPELYVEVVAYFESAAGIVSVARCGQSRIQRTKRSIG